MTATDELRRLLDERGVKWEADFADKYIHNHTQFEPNCNVAVDVWECDGELMVEVETAHCFTAIEVIEATLGRGECSLQGEWVRISQTQEVRHLLCDCGYEVGMDRRGTFPYEYVRYCRVPRYCQECGRMLKVAHGRRVVSVDE